MLTRRPSRTRRVAASGLSVAVLAGGLLVASAPAEDAPDPGASSPRAAQPAQVDAVQPEQAGALRVLRRARRASDVMPSVVASEVAGPTRFGRNPALARAVVTPTGTGWVVPGDGTVCLVAADPVDGWATTCAPTGVVRTEGLTLGLADEQGSTSTTLVPDGATVAVTDEDGRTRPVVPDESGIVALDASDADHLEIVTARGRSETPLMDAEELEAARQ